MNKNKGFIGIGLIIAIVLGAIIIGGGAYYLGKSNNKLEVKSPENILPNVENNNLPVVDNSQQVNVANTTNPVVTTGCTSSSTPSIKVLSPNGGETYTAGQKITVKWSSCNGSLDSQQIVIILKSTQSSFGSEIASVPNTGTATITLPTSLGGGSVPLISGKYYKILTQLGGNAMGYTAPTDLSDNSFTINTAPTKTVSTTLPEYVGTHSDCGLPPCWPPVITTSSQSYSCNNIGVAPNTEGNDVTAQRVINGRTYCIHSLSGGYAGGRGYTYTYMTSNGNGTKIATFGLTYQSCGVIGGPTDPTVIQCKNIQSNFSSNLDTLIDSLMFN